MGVNTGDLGGLTGKRLDGGQLGGRMVMGWGGEAKVWGDGGGREGEGAREVGMGMGWGGDGKNVISN